MPAFGQPCLASRARYGVMVVVALAAFAWPQGAGAQSWGGLYNMDSMLSAPHPFASNFRPVPPSVAPTPVVQPAAQRPSGGAVRAQPSSQQPAATETAYASSGWVWKDIFSEIRGGVFAHDTGPFSSNEEGGLDINGELLFASPKIFSYIWSPRPHIGGSFSTGGHTSQIYTGLTWEWSFWGGWFAGFSLGGMVHDGRLYGDKDGQKEKSLGCRFLFRESINAGYRFAKRHSVMLHLDHSSNASLCERNTPDGTANGRPDVVLNEGLESVGIRYGYMF
ncbi:MAG: acyloxyacyl hydrolase [Rhodospirillaceae bacterium]